MFFDFSKTYEIASSAFEKAFDRDSIEQLLVYKLDKRIDNISPPVDVWPMTVLKIIEAAEQEGWFDELMAAGKAERSENIKFQRDINLVMEKRKRFVELRESPSKHHWISVPALVVLIAAGLIWGFIIFGMTPIVALTGISIALPIAQTMLKSRVLRSLDFKLELLLRSRWGIGLVLALYAVFVGLSSCLTSIWADKNLRVDQHIKVSSPKEMLLSKGESARVLVNPFRLPELVASIDDLEEASPARVYPWSRNSLNTEGFKKPIFVAVVPPRSKLNSFRFEGWSALISVVKKSGEEVLSTSIKPYSGEPLMLGRNVALAGGRGVTPIGTIIPEALSRLSSINRAEKNPQHNVKVIVGASEYFFTTTNTRFRPRIFQRIQIEFVHTQGSRVKTKPFEITREFDGEYNVIVRQLELQGPTHD